MDYQVQSYAADPYTGLADADLIQHMAVLEARESFHCFRKYMNPGQLEDWWQTLVHEEFQQFYFDLKAGKRPKMVVEAPPQHGKSTILSDFFTWIAGKDPDLKGIYAAYSDRLGTRANKHVQRTLASPRYQRVFPDTSLGRGTGVDLIAKTQELLEYADHLGYFRNTTTGGPINGEGLDFGGIDDPLKGREEANSKTIRNKKWDWFTDDFFGRFSEYAGFIVIATRWHVDDPTGRIRAHWGDEVRVVSYPALAQVDEVYRKTGEALFPELKSRDFLLERKGVMIPVNWEAVYQQNPQIVGGEIIKGEWFNYYRELPILEWRAMYADTAQKTSERNDWSVFEVWGKAEGKLYLIDMIRGRWTAPELKRKAKAFWAKHAAEDPNKMGDLRKMGVEDKSSGTGLIQEIQFEGGIPIAAIERTKDKYTRMQDVMGYIEAGLVVLPSDAPFTSDFVVECESFTADDSHLFDDQVDPMMDAIEEMLAGNDLIELWENMI